MRVYRLFGQPINPTSSQARGLVAHWPLDCNSSTAFESIKGNAGTLTGTSKVTTYNGLGRYFNGTSDFINLGNKPEFYFQSSFSISLNIVLASYPTGGANATIISDYDFTSNTSTLNLGITGSGYGAYQNKLIFFWVYPSGTAPLLLELDKDCPLNTLVNVAITYDGVTRRIYVDGVLKNTESTVQSRVESSTNELLLGALPFNYDSFNGTINDVRLYNRALSDLEVLDIYSNPTDLYYSDNDVDSVSTGVVIGISGRSITAVAGSLSVSVSKSVTGHAVTSSAGVLIPNTAKATTGSASTLGQGSTIANNAKALTGSASTLSSGTLKAGASVAANGIALTGSAGILIPAFSKALSGAQLSTAAGFVSAGSDVNVALSGSQFSALSGTLSVSVAKAATGTASTLSVGQVVANTSKALSGSASTIGQGSMAKTVSIGMIGGSVTPSAGSLTPNTSKALTGSASTLGQGAVVATFGIVVQLSGVEITTTAGNLSVTSAVGLSGSSVDDQAGLVKSAMNRTLSGVVGTFSAGDLTAVITAGTTPPNTLYVVYIEDVQNNVFIKNAGYNVFYDNNNYTVETQ